ncbi:hypothetical protein Esti_000774 [Eimeria stiedai]
MSIGSPTGSSEFAADLGASWRVLRAKGERVTARVRRVPISITREVCGTLHGHLWWPALLRNGEKTQGTPPSSSSSLLESNKRTPSFPGRQKDAGEVLEGQSSYIAVFAHGRQGVSGRSLIPHALQVEFIEVAGKA